MSIKPKYQVKIETLLRTIESENILIDVISSRYTELLSKSPTPSVGAQEKRINPYLRYSENGIIVEGSFRFFVDDDLPSQRHNPEKGCLDRTMGSHAQIGYQYIFGYPPSLPELRGRQFEIESILESGALSDILNMIKGNPKWDSGMEDLDKALNYYRDDKLDIYDYTGYLWCYVHGKRFIDNSEGFDNVRYNEWEGTADMTKSLFGNIEKYFTLYREFLSNCARVPAWGKRVSILLEYIESVQFYFTPEFLLGSYSMSDFSNKRDPEFQKITIEIRNKITSSYFLLSKIIRHLKSEGDYFARFSLLVEMIEKEKWSKVTFDADKKFTYCEGRHPNKAYDNQVPNPSHDDRPITIYSGANTSGKSWGLQRDFFIRRAAQSLGYAPVGLGNFPKQYDTMVYLDRASTNARQKRSAYMEEVHRIIEVLRICQGRKVLVYIDEPFSTTAPADQVGMIEILIEKIQANGGDIVIATHNEEAMKSLENIYGNSLGLYHYDYSVERDALGKPYIDSHRTLMTGIADAHSIEVAEIQEAPSDLIDGARAYVDGNTVLPDFQSPVFPEIRPLSQEEYQRIIALGGLKQLYTGESIRFSLFSTDNDFAQQGIGYNDIIRRQKPQKKSRYDSDGKKVVTNTSLSNLVDIREVNRLISQMLFSSPTTSAGEILERQTLFQNLASNHQYSAILHATVGLADIEESFVGVARWKDSINHGLNPISMPRSSMGFERIPRLSHSSFGSDMSEVSQAIAYIKMNKKLLGRESPPALMELLRELRTYREFIEKYDDVANYSVEIERRGEKYKKSYIEKFIDESRPGSELSDLMGTILGNSREPTSEEKQFIATASEVFRPFVPAGFSSLGAMRKYFGSIRQKMVSISHILPKRGYEAFDNDTMSEWLESYSEMIKSDSIGTDTSKRRTRNNRGDVLFGLFDGLKGNALDLTEAIIHIRRWKKEFPRFKKRLSTIDSPYIQSSLAFLEHQYEKLCNFTIDEDIEEQAKEPHRDRSGSLHEMREKRFKRTLFEGKSEQKRYAFTSEIDRLSALCVYASNIAEGRLHPVSLNNTGEVKFIQNTNLFETTTHPGKDSEPIIGNDFMLDVGFPYQILTGPNGSGKTYFAKSGIISVLQALNTGYSQSRDATLPVFEKVIYFDRVNEQNGIHSSFANELEYWKEVWKILESGTRTLIFCDEMFSTVPPKYQAAFSHGVMAKVLRTGTSFITASHHHDWVEVIKQQLPNLPISHLSFEIADGIPIFHRKLQSGHAPSHAREVAKKLGFF